MLKKRRTTAQVELPDTDWHNAGPFAVVYVGEMMTDAAIADGKYRYYKIVDAHGDMPSGTHIPVAHPLTPWTCAERN